MPRDPATWYVMIDDAETGPLTRVELGVELATGRITGNTLVWKEGMIKWLPGTRIPELESLFKAPPRSPRMAGGARPPPPPPQKGAGLTDFDTSHFRLADLQPDDAAQQRQMEFDTSHFKLADLKADDNGPNRQMEFDTSHFRLADMHASQGARALVPRRIAPKGTEAGPEPVIPARPGKSSLKQASTAARPAAPPPVSVSSAPPPPLELDIPRKAAPEPVRLPKAKAPPPRPAAAQSDFDPNRTSVDFRTLGELVRQQTAAQSMFESELVPDAAPVEPEQPAPAVDPQELSKWAAEELKKAGKVDSPPPPVKAAKPKPPPPVPAAPQVHAPPPKQSKTTLYIAIAAIALLVIGVVVYFVLD